MEKLTDEEKKEISKQTIAGLICWLILFPIVAVILFFLLFIIF